MVPERISRPSTRAGSNQTEAPATHHALDAPAPSQDQLRLRGAFGRVDVDAPDVAVGEARVLCENVDPTRGQAAHLERAGRVGLGFVPPIDERLGLTRADGGSGHGRAFRRDDDTPKQPAASQPDPSHVDRRAARDAHARDDALRVVRGRDRRHILTGADVDLEPPIGCIDVLVCTSAAIVAAILRIERDRIRFDGFAFVVHHDAGDVADVVEHEVGLAPGCPRFDLLT
jgi:hypothetical protein